MPVARLRMISLWVMGILPAIVGIGCGGDDGDDASSKATIVSFAAEPETIQEGGVGTLQWVTKDAVSVAIVSNGQRLSLGELPTTGEVEVSPRATTSYVLEAEGRDGTVVTMATTLTVETETSLEIVAFDASEKLVGSGTAVLLSWQVTGADSIVVTDASGRKVTSAVLDLPEGSVEVSPRITTTYRLQASNRERSASAEVKVEVAKQPTIQLDASASQVEFGGSLTLSWTATDADSVEVIGPMGEEVYSGPAPIQEVAVVPEVAGTYQAIAHGIGGTARDAILVGIAPVIERFQVESDPDSRPGNLAEITWKVRGAETVEVTNNAGYFHKSSKDSDTVDAPLADDGGFLLIARNGAVTSVQAASASISERPVIRSFSATGPVNVGESVNLRWEVDGAAKIRIELVPGGLVDVTGKSPRKDDVDVVLMQPGLIRFTATNLAGETVTSIPAPLN